ncbi:sterol desaturase family protein [Puia sp.]|jgi:sterol desaturase/sphingolipid hydroxylase (fatty acid hydroxylase superfamily)|uniref:sterol desaturase family protein n=1 Tax=Puia sp. TaxID=2045100 RepID=UPI002F404865
MESLSYYFQHIPSYQRSLILAGGLVLFWIIEGIIPLIRFRYRRVRHAGLNLFFTLTTVIINFAFAALIIRAADYSTAHHTGLLYLLPLPLWAFTLIGLMILDLIGAWFIHWIHHQIKWLWKFHLVHHSDTWVDTTTANRHHPGESFFRALFTLIAVIVAGSPVWLVFLYQSLSVLFSQFNHANISLPKWLDAILAWIVVSPNMHKVHHHYRRPLTDTNYGNIFSIWDRLFGTYRVVRDPKDLVYGIDTHPEEVENNRINALLGMPFQAYRPPTNEAPAEPAN